MWYWSVLFLMVGLVVMVVSIMEHPADAFLSAFALARYSTAVRTTVLMLTPHPEQPSPLSRFGVVYYINLDHRVDRRQQIEEELHRMNTPSSQVVRIPGVVPEDRKGAVGCTMAHINTLKDFLSHPEWETCAVFEDDFQFTVTPEELEARLQAFFETHQKDWDVLMLGGSINQTETVDDQHASAWRVSNASLLSGYVINRRIASTLLHNFQAGLKKLQRRYDLTKYAVDEYWKRLQKDRLWFALRPLVGTQRASYSDIDHRRKEVKSKVRQAPSVERKALSPTIND